MVAPPIPPARLLQHVDDALLVVGPDLVIRHVANIAAAALSPFVAAGRTLVGARAEDALGSLFAPLERPGFILLLRGALDPTGSGTAQRTIEGAAPAAVRSAGLTPFYDVTVRRYVDDDGVLLSVSIRDASDRQQLRDALAIARDERDIALAVLRGEPDATWGFLRDALEALGLVQSLQRLPARSADAYRSKLQRIAHELRPVADGAGRLGLTAIVRSALDVIAALERAASRAVPSGDDFLPIAATLDALFRHLVLAARNAELRDDWRRTDTTEEALPDEASSDGGWPASISVRLADCVDKAAEARGCRASLSVSGLELLPARCQRSVEPLLLHVVRNAVTHGIEAPGEREAASKAVVGQVGLACRMLPQGGHEIVVSDDGRGLDVADVPFLQDLVMRMGGSVGMSTSRGRYTRLRIQLPPDLSPSA